jgi:leucyl aminopeptidase (aminopeptidase T)
MQSLEGETPMRLSLVELASGKGKIGGLPNCTIDVLEAGFSPQNRPEFSGELYDFLLNVTEIELTCDRGSQVTALIDHDTYDLVNSNGVLVPGNYANPIPAEVFAHPADVLGTLVISGSYGPLMGFAPFVGNYRALMEALNKTPVTWKITGGKITDVSCENNEIQSFVRKEVFEKDTEHGMKIGEFGMPANLYVLGREITGNLMIDEKGRVHLANGHGYQKRTRCEYDTSVHGDGLIANASLRAVNLDKQFMKNNQYSSEIFKTL